MEFHSIHVKAAEAAGDMLRSLDCRECAEVFQAYREFDKVNADAFDKLTKTPNPVEHPPLMS